MVQIVNRRTVQLAGAALALLLMISCSRKTSTQIAVSNFEQHVMLETDLSARSGQTLPADLVFVQFNDDTSAFFQKIKSWQDQACQVGAYLPVEQKIILNESKKSVFKNLLSACINKDVKVIILEVPVFENGKNYSPAFRNYWQKTIDSKWIEPADSADLYYRSAKLKQKSFVDFLHESAISVKNIALEQGKKIDIFLSSKSSIASTAQNKISPGISGFRLESIAGVVGERAAAGRDFTYQNQSQQNLFPVNYMDFSWFTNSVSQTGKTLFLPLHSPMEVSPERNDEVIVASLMQTSIEHFHFKAISSSLSRQERIKAGILIFVAESLEKIPPSQVRWRYNPWPKTGIIFSDTYMFESGMASTCRLESFYQLTMPFLERGVPVQIVPLERVGDQQYLNQFDVLYMSYEGYKPALAQYHEHIRRWVVRRGGALFFYIGTTGIFDEIEEWWADQYDRPHEHLFELLKTGLYPESGMHKVGRGIVYTERNSPRRLAETPQGGEIIWNTYTEILTSYVHADSIILNTKNRLYLQRGPYHLIYVPASTPSFSVTGNFIDLLADNLNLIEQKKFVPGETGLLLNIDYFPPDSMVIACSSAKVLDMRSDSNLLEFSSLCFPETPVITFLRLPENPGTIECTGLENERLAFKQQWYPGKNLLRVETNSRGGKIHYKIRY